MRKPGQPVQAQALSAADERSSTLRNEPGGNRASAASHLLRARLRSQQLTYRLADFILDLSNCLPPL